MKADIFDAYVDAICENFQMSKRELFKKTKQRAIVTARQALYYVCMKRNMRIVEIQTMMKKHGLNFPHTTILHGFRAMSERMEHDQDYQSIINQIQTHGASQEKERV